MSSGEQFRESDGIQHELVGNSAAIVALAHRIARIAPAKLPVLIQGESGTGKELVARAVHTNSPYSNGPFVAVNSAALSENLAKSELFGHERGSFTGAVAQQRGCFELANNGTLWLAISLPGTQRKMDCRSLSFLRKSMPPFSNMTGPAMFASCSIRCNKPSCFVPQT